MDGWVTNVQINDLRSFHFWKACEVRVSRLLHFILELSKSINFSINKQQFSVDTLEKVCFADHKSL